MCMIKIIRFFRKLFFLFFLQSTLLIVFYSSCAGYFINSTKEKSVKTVTPTTDALPSTFSYYLVWSDGEQFYNQQHSQFELVIPPPKSLSGCYIPITELMTLQRWSYLPSDFSIEDLLYANLKLNRLFQEYNSLKERSAKILAGLEVPYMDRPFEIRPLISANEGTLSLQIDTVSNQIRQLTGPVLSHSEKEKFNHPTIQKPTLQSKKRTPLHTIRQPLNSSTSSSSSNSQSFSSLNGVGSEPESDPSAIKPNKQYGNSLNKNRPWIERFAVSLINYFKANKAELIIWLILCFGIYQMLFRSRKH